MKINRVSLGTIIKNKVEEKGLSQAEFARRIGLQRQNIVRTVFEKESLDTNLLCVISEVLDCNFFNYFQSDNVEDRKEIKATVTIEMGQCKQDKTFRFIFGDNELNFN